MRRILCLFILWEFMLAGAACAARLPTEKGSRQAAVRAPVWAVQLKFTYAATIPVQAWPERTFAKIAADGIHHAEINMQWGAVEPRRGDFNFTLLDQTMANAAPTYNPASQNPEKLRRKRVYS